MEDEMAFRMRSSKFRHVYGETVKKEYCYENVRITKNQHDSSFCAVNPKFLAVVVESAGGGVFLVLPINKTGRIDINSPKVCGHSGPVLDIKWNPFDDNMIASCSDDATIKVWKIPEGGLTENLSEWIVDLHGHQRRIGYIEWHPTAEHILMSAGFDFNVIIWNIETAEPINIITCHTDTIYSISWNRDGSLFATTSKDKKLRVIEPRSGKVVAEGGCHTGPKASKVVFLGSTERLLTTGFSRHSERQFGIWDIHDLSQPLKFESVDSSSGVLLPYYDHDTSVVFLAGKGDGNIRYYEIVQERPFCHFLNVFQSGYPQRSLGFMPKRGCDTSRCEIIRFYKLHSSKTIVEPIHMRVPRKSELFQEDIFPPTAGATPSLTAQEWINGQNRDPILISLRDGSLALLPPPGAKGRRSSYHPAALAHDISTVKPSRQRFRRRSTPSVHDVVPETVQNKSPDYPYQISEDGATNPVNTPMITTYKSVKRSQMASPHVEPANVQRQSQREQVPKSIRNIHKLSMSEDTIANINDIIEGKVNPEELEQKSRKLDESFSVNERVSVFEQHRPTHSSPGLHTEQPDRHPSPIPINGIPKTDNELPEGAQGLDIDQAACSSLASGEQNNSSLRRSTLTVSLTSPKTSTTFDYGHQNSSTPKNEQSSIDIESPSEDISASEISRVRSTSVREMIRRVEDDSFYESPNSENVHVKKSWTPKGQSVEDQIAEHNGHIPQTDPETNEDQTLKNLRKAYFRQLEEIRCMKEQLSLRDKRIRQLEEEVSILKMVDAAFESNC